MCSNNLEIGGLMNKRHLFLVIISACLFIFCGCETIQQSSNQSEFDRISTEIDRELEQSLRQGPAAGAGGGLGNIRVDVKMLSTEVENYSLLEGILMYDSNSAAARSSSGAGKGGLNVVLAAGDLAGRIRYAQENLRSAESTELFIVVSSGSRGFISAGTEIAVPRFYYGGRWFTGVEYDFRHAGRSLSVVPTLLPNGNIRLEIWPVFSNFLSDGGDLELTELKTVINVSPGRSVVIGGNTDSSYDIADALLMYEKSGRKWQSVIMAKASVY